MVNGTEQQLCVKEFNLLKQKVSEYADQIQLLKNENQQLKEKIVALEVGADDNDCAMPRKIAKPYCINIEAAKKNQLNKNLPADVEEHGDNAGAWKHVEKANKQKRKIIQAIDTNVLTIRKHIVNANCVNFSVQQASASAPVKITVNTENEVALVRSALSRAKVSFHEYKNSDEKCKCFIIRGLVGITEGELPEVKGELIKNGLPDNIVLSLHVTGFMRANINKRHNVPVKMVVPPNFDTNVLEKIKFLNHVAVKFVLFKNKAVIQCRNCQRFGHSASGCQHQHRCVKCGLNHLRADCPRTHNAHHKLKCCNCGGEHTANNINSCSYYQKMLEAKARDKHAASTINNNINLNASLKRNGTSFSDVVRGSSTSGTSVSNGATSLSNFEKGQVSVVIFQLCWKLFIIWFSIMRNYFQNFYQND